MASNSIKGPSGWVRGLSMWPALIPGDMLRAAEVPAGKLRPGMTCVLRPECGEPFVHRIVRLRNFRDALAVTTAGDSSGMDVNTGLLRKDERVLVVTGVLRRRRYWRLAAHVAVPLFMKPLAVRFWNLLVRRCLW